MYIEKHLSVLLFIVLMYMLISRVIFQRIVYETDINCITRNLVFKSHPKDWLVILVLVSEWERGRNYTSYIQMTTASTLYIQIWL